MNTLMHLGVLVCEKSYMFGDSKLVVDSSTLPYSKLHKRHNILSYHRVPEVIASLYVDFNFIKRDTNPANILSGHWSYAQIWNRLKPILF